MECIVLGHKRIQDFGKRELKLRRERGARVIGTCRWLDNVKSNLKKKHDEREWIHLAPYNGQWQAFVNWAMQLFFSSFMLCWYLLCSMLCLLVFRVCLISLAAKTIEVILRNARCNNKVYGQCTFRFYQVPQIPLTNF